MWKRGGNMTNHLEELCAWLQTFPGAAGERILVDHLQAIPGSLGLYPLGLELVEQREDVLGNRWETCRQHFLLRRQTAGQEDNRQGAQWLMKLQAWISQCSREDRMPRFSDPGLPQAVWADSGRLQEARQTGTGVYQVKLTVEFTKRYEEMEHGKN